MGLFQSWGWNLVDNHLLHNGDSQGNYPQLNNAPKYQVNISVAYISLATFNLYVERIMYAYTTIFIIDMFAGYKYTFWLSSIIPFLDSLSLSLSLCPYFSLLLLSINIYHLFSLSHFSLSHSLSSLLISL